VLLLRQPEHPVGWCFAGLATAIGLAISQPVLGLLLSPVRQVIHQQKLIISHSSKEL